MFIVVWLRCIHVNVVMVMGSFVSAFAHSFPHYAELYVCVHHVESVPEVCR